ncbi:hypothetical protein NDU88_004628 [Pleurodeles waltl]|uniref:Uncharacterized protein n=1 Tax=Pleurodeles waltl TaxID=8319 RepID=A0AAV7V5P2_PLEWA|nr:hypothetical protein NDU88_004628 [Pleurodeles waltl]
MLRRAATTLLAWYRVLTKCPVLQEGGSRRVAPGVRAISPHFSRYYYVSNGFPVINSTNQGPICPLEEYRRSSEHAVQSAQYPSIGRSPGREFYRLALTASWELCNPKPTRLPPPQFFKSEALECFSARSHDRGGRRECPLGLARFRRPQQLPRAYMRFRLCSVGSITGER